MSALYYEKIDLRYKLDQFDIQIIMIKNYA